MKWTADRKHPDWEWTVGRVRHAICRRRSMELVAPRLDPNTEEVCGRCRSPIPNGARKFAIAAALASDTPRQVQDQHANADSSQPTVGETMVNGE